MLLDSRALGGDNHHTPLFRSNLIVNYDVQFDAKGIWGSLATWEGPAGGRWIFAPLWGPVHPEYRFPNSNGDNSDGSIGAFKLEGLAPGTWRILDDNEVKALLR